MVARDVGAVRDLPGLLGAAVDRLYESAVAEGCRSIVVSKFIDEEIVHLFGNDGTETYLVREGGEWREAEFELAEDEEGGRQ